SRATQNRAWIYVAGLTGLGVAAASGALAAASAVAAGTLAIMAIAGGFATAGFATINNPALADVYTVAANDMETALAEADAQVTQCPYIEDCRVRLAQLMRAIGAARNTLETGRTSNAAGALARATAQKKLLDDEIARATTGAKGPTGSTGATS